MKKIILTLVAALVVLQGCSKQEKFTTEQLQSLTNSANITNLEKSEFNVADNKLVLTTKEEIIDEQSAKELLSTLKINNLSGSQLVGLENLTAKNFSDKDFNVEVKTANNNSLVFNTKDVNAVTYNISNKKYSENYVKLKIADFSKELISFDEKVGLIETALLKGSLAENTLADYKTQVRQLENTGKILTLLTKENTDYSSLENLSKTLVTVDNLVKRVKTDVDSAVAGKTATPITNTFLNINDIDKIARTLK